MRRGELMSFYSVFSRVKGLLLVWMLSLSSVYAGRHLLDTWCADSEALVRT